MLENEGYCICCDQNTIFKCENYPLREFYLCTKCGSSPRERALMKVIEMYYPNWRDLIIHESSPVMKGASLKLKKECKGYISSQYWPELKIGETYNGVININLEKQNFKSNMFDLVITQDVFEHIYNPKAAIKEIYRTLKPNGAHICTIPLNKNKPTEQWSVIKNGKVSFLHEPEYHVSSVDLNGSPVSFHYGYDITFLVQSWANFSTTIVYIDDITYGIRAECIEVIIMKKKDKTMPNILQSVYHYLSTVFAVK